MLGIRRLTWGDHLSLLLYHSVEDHWFRGGRTSGFVLLPVWEPVGLVVIHHPVFIQAPAYPKSSANGLAIDPELGW